MGEKKHMIQFLEEGLEELAETAKSIPLAVIAYLKKHFPRKETSKQLALFAMLAYAALLIALPNILSLVLAFLVVMLAPMVLGAFVFAQASLQTAVFWAKRFKRLENSLPNCYASLQENGGLLLGLTVFSWLPFPGIQLRALMLLPLLTTELFVIIKVIMKALETELPELINNPVTQSCALLSPVISYSGIQSTAEFFGFPLPETSRSNT